MHLPWKLKVFCSVVTIMDRLLLRSVCREVIFLISWNQLHLFWFLLSTISWIHTFHLLSQELPLIIIRWKRTSWCHIFYFIKQCLKFIINFIDSKNSWKSVGFNIKPIVMLRLKILTKFLTCHQVYKCTIGILSPDLSSLGIITSIYDHIYVVSIFMNKFGSKDQLFSWTNLFSMRCPLLKIVSILMFTKIMPSFTDSFKRFSSSWCKTVPNTPNVLPAFVSNSIEMRDLHRSNSIMWPSFSDMNHMMSLVG